LKYIRNLFNQMEVSLLSILTDRKTNILPRNTGLHNMAGTCLDSPTTIPSLQGLNLHSSNHQSLLSILPTSSMGNLHPLLLLTTGLRVRFVGRSATKPWTATIEWILHSKVVIPLLNWPPWLLTHLPLLKLNNHGTWTAVLIIMSPLNWRNSHYNSSLTRVRIVSQ
jgi:hypothetical protein